MFMIANNHDSVTPVTKRYDHLRAFYDSYIWTRLSVT